MPYEAGGVRHTGPAMRACVHGQIIFLDGFVGTVFKVDQPDRFTRPAQADDIALDEEVEVQIGGVHEAPAVGNLAAAQVGDDIYINLTSDALGVAAQGIAAGALVANWRKVGKVTEVDASRNPDVLRINGNGFVLAQVVPL